MKKTFLLSIVTAFLLLTFASAEFDGYIVRLKSDVPMLFSETESDMKYIAPNLYKVSDEATVEALRAGGFVERVTKNEILELFDTTEETVDTYYSWTDVVMKADYAAELGLDGTGVRVAVIDSGFEGGNKNLKNANIAAGYDYVEDTGDEMSDNIGHGTKVIQMIVGDGEGRAVRGIAPEATVVPFRCFYRTVREDGKTVDTAETADLLQAMYDAVDVYDCNVVNLSWGFGSDFTELQKAVKHIEDAGAILVASAGNVSDKQPQGTLIYPAAYENAVGVGSVDHTYTIASSSQQTAAVDACAPGVKVVFYNTSDQLVYSSGTSFAAPAVSGAAALLKQLQPKLTTAAMLDLLAERAVDLGDAGYDTVYGHGFVRMDKFLEKSWMFASNGAAGWLRNDGSTLVKAMYETSGRMAGASFTQTEQSIEAFAKSFSEGETASFFLTDAGGVPLTKAIRK